MWTKIYNVHVSTNRKLMTLAKAVPAIIELADLSFLVDLSSLCCLFLSVRKHSLSLLWSHVLGPVASLPIPLKFFFNLPRVVFKLFLRFICVVSVYSPAQTNSAQWQYYLSLEASFVLGSREAVTKPPCEMFVLHYYYYHCEYWTLQVITCQFTSCKLSCRLSQTDIKQQQEITQQCCRY